MKVKPITPDEVQLSKDIPDKVVEIFNKRISKNWNGYQSVVYQDEISQECADSMNVERSVVYENRWLDIEPLFRSSGWNVHYDKPAYCENYRAHWIFTKK